MNRFQNAIVRGLTASIVVGVDVLLAWGISSTGGISFDRALLLLVLLGLAVISYDQREYQ